MQLVDSCDPRPGRPMESRQMLLRFLSALHRRRLGMSVAVGTFVAIMFLTYFVDPEFECTTSIYVPMENLPNLPFSDALSQERTITGELGGNIMNTLVSVLTSRPIAEEIVRRFRLDRPRESRNPRDLMHLALSGAVTSVFKLLDSLGLMKYSSDRFRGAVDDLQDGIEAEVSENSELIVLTVRHGNARETQEITQTLVELFTQRAIGMTRQNARRLLDFNQRQLPAARKNFLKADQELYAYKQKHGIVLIEDQKKSVINRLDSLDSVSQDARVVQRESTRRLAWVRQQLKRQSPSIVSATSIENNPLVEDLKQSLYEQEKELAALLTKYTDSPPERDTG